MNERPRTALKSLTAAALVIIVCGSAPAAPRPSAPSPIQENSNTVRVRVVDESNGEGIEGASVLVRSVSVTNQTGQELFGPTATDISGWATITADGTGKLRVEISKPGYKYKSGQGDNDENAGGRLIDFGPAQRQRRLLVTLVRGTAEDKFKITVRVADGADNAPLAGARVVVRHPAVARETYELTTGADGTASADLIAFGGTYQMEVSKDGYKAGRSSFESAGGHRQPDIKLPVALEKESKDYAVRLVVKVLSAEGNQPVVDAKVEVWSRDDYSTLPAHLERTDGAGQTAVSVAESGSYRVKVTHSNFRGKTQPVQVRKYSDAREVPLNFSLARGSGEDEEEGEEGAKTVKVFIEVKDAETRENVRGAEVRLKLKDGSLHATENTLDSGGMLTFEVPTARAREGMTAEVSQSWVRDGKKVVEYEPNASDVPGPPRGGGPIGLNVYLTKSAEAKKSEEEEKEKEEEEARKKKEAAEKSDKEIRDEIDRLNAEVGGLSSQIGSIISAHETFLKQVASLRASADEAYKDVEAMRDRQGDEATAHVVAACRAAAEVRAGIAEAADAAEGTEREMQEQLDHAEKLAAECSDEADAQLIKDSYNEAIQALASIGVANRQAEAQNRHIEGGMKDLKKLKDGWIALGAMSKAVGEQAQAARKAADIIGKNAAGWQTTVGELSDKSSGLRAQVVTKVAEWRKLTLPKDLSQHIDDLESHAVGGLKLDAAKYRFTDGVAAAEAQVARLAEMAAEAGRLAQPIDQTCADFTPAAEEASRIDRVFSTLTIEVGAAASLPAKADECLEKLKKTKKGAEEEKKKDDEEEAPESVEEGPEAEAEPSEKSEKGKPSPEEGAPTPAEARPSTNTTPPGPPSSSITGPDMSGTWVVVSRCCGVREFTAEDTHRFEITPLGGDRWNVRSTVIGTADRNRKFLGSTQEWIMRAVDEGGGRLRLTISKDAQTLEAIGTYSQGQFSVVYNNEGWHQTFDGKRQ